MTGGAMHSLANRAGRWSEAQFEAVRKERTEAERELRSLPTAEQQKAAQDALHGVPRAFSSSSGTPRRISRRRRKQRTRRRRSTAASSRPSQGVACSSLELSLQVDGARVRSHRRGVRRDDVRHQARGSAKQARVDLLRLDRHHGQ